MHSLAVGTALADRLRHLRYRATWRATVREYQFACHDLTPLAHATLQRSELTVRELLRVLLLQSLEVTLCGCFRFYLKPHKHLRPHRIKRIFSGAPVSWFAAWPTMSSAWFTQFPKVRQSREKLFQTFSVRFIPTRVTQFGQRRLCPYFSTAQRP